MKQDFKQWETKIQVDDDRQCMLVETAQEMLYIKVFNPMQRPSPTCWPLGH